MSDLPVGHPVMFNDVGDTLVAHSMENTCDRAPDRPYTQTDLATAGVGNDVELCSNCDWPEGAETVVTLHHTVWYADENGVTVVHRGEGECGHVPENARVTQLVEFYGGDVALCEYCEWPADVIEVIGDG